MLCHWTAGKACSGLVQSTEVPREKDAIQFGDVILVQTGEAVRVDEVVRDETHDRSEPEQVFIT